MMKIDMWYENPESDIAFASVTFCDLDMEYRGNVYDCDKRMIGDFCGADSVEIERKFPGIFGN